MIERIKTFLLAFLFKKHFTFRFQYYDTDTVVNDTNVIEYEFVNVGRTSVLVNDMELFKDNSGGGGLGLYEDTFRRWKCKVNYNEVDTTIYRIKFPKIDCVKVCKGTFTIFDWVTCNGMPTDCEYITQLFISGIPITNPFNINCNTGATQNLWQQAIDNNISAGFTGTITVTFNATADPLKFDVLIDVFNVSLPCTTNPVLLSISFSTQPTQECPNYLVQPTPMVCILPEPAPKGKLLVISKCLAGLKDNP